MDFGIGLTLSLVSKAIYDLIKKISAVSCAALKCDEQCHTLQLLLQRMGPGFEVVKNLLSRLLELDPKDRPIFTGIQGWLDKLKTQLDAAHETVDKCLQNVSGWNLCALLKKCSLSGKLTELVKNIESLDSEMTLYTLLLHSMCRPLKENKPTRFRGWVKEKDDILEREEETRRREAALHAWTTSDRSQQGYPVIQANLHTWQMGCQIGYPANGTRLRDRARASQPLYPEIRSQPSYPESASRTQYPEIAIQPIYPAFASQPLYSAIASQPSYPGSASQPLYPEIASQPLYPAIANQPCTEVHDQCLFRHQYGTVGPVPEDKHAHKEAKYKSVEDVKVPAARPGASYVMEPKPHGENDKKEKWHDRVAEEEKKSRQPFKRLHDKVRRTFHSNKGS